MFLLNESCHTCKMNLHSFTWSLRLELHNYWLVYCLCRAGDARVNVIPSLGWSHALFLREHNRIAKIFANINPRWSDETIFQETRRLVAAIIQVQLHFNSTSSFLLHLLFLHLFIVLPFLLHLPQSPCFCFYLRSHLSILSDEGRHLPQSPCFCLYLRSHLSTISDEGRHLPQSPCFGFYLRPHMSTTSDEGRHFLQSHCLCFYLRSHLTTTSDKGRHLLQVFHLAVQCFMYSR